MDSDEARTNTRMRSSSAPGDTVCACCVFSSSRKAASSSHLGLGSTTQPHIRSGRVTAAHKSKKGDAQATSRHLGSRSPHRSSRHVVDMAGNAHGCLATLATSQAICAVSAICEVHPETQLAMRFANQTNHDVGSVVKHKGLQAGGPAVCVQSCTALQTLAKCSDVGSVFDVLWKDQGSIRCGTGWGPGQGQPCVWTCDNLRVSQSVSERAEMHPHMCDAGRNPTQLRDAWRVF